MMEGTLQVCVSVLLLSWSCADTLGKSKTVEVTVDEYCNSIFGELKSISNSFKLTLTRKSAYQNWECTPMIEEPFRPNLQILVQFLNIDISCNDSLRFYDGSTVTSPELGSATCEESPSEPFTTSGHYLHMTFTSGGAVRDHHSSFTLLITVFHTGLCKSGEYECDNGRCISTGLKCNGYDNCGDHTDDKSKGTCFFENYWYILLFAVITALVLGVVMYYRKHCRLRSTPGIVLQLPTSERSAIPYEMMPRDPELQD